MTELLATERSADVSLGSRALNAYMNCRDGAGFWDVAISFGIGFASSAIWAGWAKDSIFFNSDFGTALWSGMWNAETGNYANQGYNMTIRQRNRRNCFDVLGFAFSPLKGAVGGYLSYSLNIGWEPAVGSSNIGISLPGYGVGVFAGYGLVVEGVVYWSQRQ